MPLTISATMPQSTASTMNVPILPLLQSLAFYAAFFIDFNSRVLLSL